MATLSETAGVRLTHGLSPARPRSCRSMTTQRRPEIWRLQAQRNVGPVGGELADRLAKPVIQLARRVRHPHAQALGADGAVAPVESRVRAACAPPRWCNLDRGSAGSPDPVRRASRPSAGPARRGGGIDAPGFECLRGRRGRSRSAAHGRPSLLPPRVRGLLDQAGIGAAAGVRLHLQLQLQRRWFEDVEDLVQCRDRFIDGVAGDEDASELPGSDFDTGPCPSVVRSRSGSWMTTISPSRLRWRSSSTASTASFAVFRKPPRLVSAHRFLAPRWAMIFIMMLPAPRSV